MGSSQLANQWKFQLSCSLCGWIIVHKISILVSDHYNRMPAKYEKYGSFTVIYQPLTTSFSFHINTYEKYIIKLPHLLVFCILIHVLCCGVLPDINECTTSNPCKNGSTCVNKIGGYQCLCVPGYFGIHCDKGKIYVWMHFLLKQPNYW